jgi:hypothetical protein
MECILEAWDRIEPESEKGVSMSLAIDPSRVNAVLLADGWHNVDPIRDRLSDTTSSFILDAYEYVDGDRLIFNGEGAPTLSAMGFSFRQGDVRFFGPITSILAVKSVEG